MQPLLTPEDSKRVADELIAAIKRIEFKLEPMLKNIAKEVLGSYPHNTFGDKLIVAIAKAVKENK
jgi:hypothetical protein